MDREQYLQELFGRLSNHLPRRELESVMRYYEEYFDEVGPQREGEVIAQLGTPAELAERILGERGAHPRRAPIAGIAISIAVVCMIGCIGALVGYTVFHSSTHMLVESTVQEVDVYWDAEPFTSVYVDIPVGNVVFMDGDAYSAELGEDERALGLSAQVEGGVLYVQGGTDSAALGGYDIEDGEIYIYIPYGVTLDRLTVHINAGNLNINNIAANTADLSVDAGQIECYSLITQESLATNMELGNVYLSGRFLGETVVTNQMGAVELEVDGAAAEYSYQLSTQLGSITVDGREGGFSTSVRAGANEITVKNETGSIELWFCQ